MSDNPFFTPANGTNAQPVDLDQPAQQAAQELEQPTDQQEPAEPLEEPTSLEEEPVDAAEGIDEPDDDQPDPTVEEPSPEPSEKLREWQSKYDKLQAEFDRYKQSASLPEEVLNLADAIQKQPELLDVIDKYQTGQPIGPKYAADSPEAIQQKLAALKAPTKPERPKDGDYEAMEAYEQARQDYIEQRLDYLDQKEALSEQLQTAKAAQAEQAQAAQAAQAKLQTQLKTDFKFTDAEVSGFFETFNTQPELKDLVTLYRIKTGKLKAPQAANPSQPAQPARRSPAPAVGASRGPAPASGGFFSSSTINRGK